MMQERELARESCQWVSSGLGPRLLGGSPLASQKVGVKLGEVVAPAVHERCEGRVKCSHELMERPDRHYLSKSNETYLPKGSRRKSAQSEDLIRRPDQQHFQADGGASSTPKPARVGLHDKP